MRSRLRLLGIAATAVMLLIGFAPPAQAEPAPQPSTSAPTFAPMARTGPWEVFPNRPATPWPCLEIGNGRRENNRPSQIGHCNAIPDRQWQEWWMDTIPGTTYWRLVNYYTDKCLYPDGFNTGNGVYISQYTCNASDQWQHWSVHKRCSQCDGRDYYIWQNRKTGKCINHRNSGTVGNAMIQYTCGAVDENYTDLFTWWSGTV